MAYKRKTKDEYELHVKYSYGNGWEYILTESTRSEIKKRMREYLENDGYLIDIRIKKVRIPL